MKKRKWMMFAGMLMAVTMLTACGSSYYESAAATEEIAMENTASYAADTGGGIYSKSAEYDMAAAEEGVAEAAAADDAAASELNEFDDEAYVTQEGQENIEGAVAKKLIKNLNLELETKEYDKLVFDITAQVNSLGGYIENSAFSDYSKGTSRYASIVARVPSESLDSFVNKVAEQSNVIYRNESVQDVTLQYVDLDSHKKSLLTEQKRLLELLEKAETVADIIEIESRLSEVRYQIESMESQLRTIDNQVNYSTVYININEVELLTPVAEKTIWQKISDGFGNNVYRLIRGLENLAIGFIISLPFIFVWIIVIIVLLLIVRLILKREKKARKKRQEKMAVKRAQEADYIIVPTSDNQNIHENGQENTGDSQGVKKVQEKDGEDGTTV